ncbi:hypothetical protein [Frankia sp. CIT1]|uniref:hypothetical protein n=1 Tax=Frankia sp. CIT1 TaxID=2880974 RepID=UPI001EF562C4|nr:hypothetical protein [Frankia sp. CIT1]
MAVFAGRCSLPVAFPDGTPARNISITVCIAGTSQPAVLYAGRTRTTPSENPLTTTGSAVAAFWADPGVYDLVGPGFVIASVPTCPDSGEYAGLDITGRLSVGIMPVGSTAGTVAAGDDSRIVHAVGSAITGGVAADRVETMHRLWAGGAVAIPPGSALMSLVTAEATLTVDTLTTWRSGVGAVGASTARMGLYQLDASGSTLVCIARTDSDATLWTADAGQENSRPIVDNGGSAPAAISQVTLTQGARYAIAAFVDAATVRGPQLAGAWLGVPGMTARPPALAYAGPAGEGDLRPTYPLSLLTPTASVLYGEAA